MRKSYKKNERLSWENYKSILHFYMPTSLLNTTERISNDYMYSYLETRGITCEERPRIPITFSLSMN